MDWLLFCHPPGCCLVNNFVTLIFWIIIYLWTSIRCICCEARKIESECEWKLVHACDWVKEGIRLYARTFTNIFYIHSPNPTRENGDPDPLIFFFLLFWALPPIFFLDCYFSPVVEWELVNFCGGCSVDFVFPPRFQIFVFMFWFFLVSSLVYFPVSSLVRVGSHPLSFFSDCRKGLVTLVLLFV